MVKAENRKQKSRIIYQPMMLINLLITIVKNQIPASLFPISA